jgi:hypothetical protein
MSNDEVSKQIFYALTGKTGNIASITLEKVEDFAQVMFRTFWSFYVSDQDLAWTVLFRLGVLIALGLAYIWWRHKEIRLWLSLLAFHTVLFFILPLIRLLTTGFVHKAGQGQHVLFPAASAWTILIMWGMSGWFPTRGNKQWLGGILLGIGLLY